MSLPFRFMPLAFVDHLHLFMLLRLLRDLVSEAVCIIKL